VTNRTAGLEEDLLLREVDVSQMRQEECEVVRRKGGEHPIGRMRDMLRHWRALLLLPSKGGSVVASLGRSG
jgi:hypothetical protein